METYLGELFEHLTGDTMDFYGGTTDAVYGSTYYLNGFQMVGRYRDDTDASSARSASAVILEGSGIAYDYLHHGSCFEHGSTGEVDALVFGEWAEGITSGQQGAGEDGRVADFDADLAVEGFSLDVAPGGGTDAATTRVYALYKAVQEADADALFDIWSEYAVNVTEGSGDNNLIGFEFADELSGGRGDDTLISGDGHDTLVGGHDDDIFLF